VKESNLRHSTVWICALEKAEEEWSLNVSAFKKLLYVSCPAADGQLFRGFPLAQHLTKFWEKKKMFLLLVL
jgi:hypothetical protein